MAEIETPKVDASATPEGETPTQESVEDRIAKLEEAVKTADAKADEKDKGFRTLQQKYDKLYKQQSEPGKNDSTRLMLDEIERLGSSVYSDDSNAQARISTLKAEIGRIEQAAQYNTKMREQQQIAGDKRVELEDKIREAGGDPEDIKFDGVWDSWELSSLADGKFERADTRLDKILKVKPAETKPVETEDKIRERIERETLEKYKLTSPEKTRPSAAGKNIPTKMEDFREWVKEHPDEYRESKKEVDEMLTKGLIK